MNETLQLAGKVFNIQRFSTHDGPGVRTTVFLKGCPLRCFWCQNPESQTLRPVLLHNAGDCVGCGNCASVCAAGAARIEAGRAVIDTDRCTGCGDCLPVCPSETFAIAGRDMTVGEVVSEVIKDRMQYINSGGGVTLSGGEPLTQHAFSLALLAACKGKGIHTVLETCGYCDYSIIREIARHVDLFLYDIKTLDDEKHIDGTGVSNNQIIENARRLVNSGEKILLRMPLIPGFNDNEAEVKALLAFAKELGLGPADVNLLKYNPLGEAKYEKLGRGQELRRLEAQSDEYFEHLSGLLAHDT